MSHPLETVLNYNFHDDQILLRAMTHSSGANEMGLGHNSCNERLEFLGDSILGFVTANFLYSTFPDLPEGSLSKIRAELVCEQSLSQVASELGLGNYLILGRGEEKNGGRTRPSMTADAVEALIAALYLDGGFELARSFILRFVLSPDKISSFGHDYKSELQELIQKEKNHLLSYQLIGEAGPDHEKVFRVSVLLDGSEIGQGEGQSKKKAEQAAAKSALSRLSNHKSAE